jgi:hypothetical protein
MFLHLAIAWISSVTENPSPLIGLDSGRDASRVLRPVARAERLDIANLTVFGCVLRGDDAKHCTFAMNEDRDRPKKEGDSKTVCVSPFPITCTTVRPRGSGNREVTSNIRR